MSKAEEVQKRLKGAVRAAMDQAKEDPQFLSKVVDSVCTELGLDPVVSIYLAGKLRAHLSKEKADVA